MNNNTTKKTAPSSQNKTGQNKTGFVEEHALFILPSSTPIRTEIPIERKFKTADLFQFKRRRGDYIFSLFIVLVVAMLVWHFPSETGWPERNLPQDMLSYIASQFGLIAPEEPTIRFGKILKQDWVAPLICLMILVPSALINLRLSTKTLKRKIRQQAPSRWKYEISQWARAIEYIIYFVIYTMLVPLLGYLVSTLLMGCFLTWRLGYRSRQWMLIALASSLAIVILFRSLLQIKTPVNIWLYNIMPETMSYFFKTWF